MVSNVSSTGVPGISSWRIQPYEDSVAALVQAYTHGTTCGSRSLRAAKARAMMATSFSTRVFWVHSLGITVREAQYEFLGALRNGDTAGLSRFIFGRVVRGDGRRQGDAIDIVIVFERAFRVVLDGDDLCIFLVRTWA